ncbi:hypothetical protein BOTBODRAFT_140680 [Botryobasidium botryosum FD-172 SS1]|uniref:Uncharacterized protein n=1 Tax=Botryobasidium botryosum (strain FD-172 SS1) TaxID=930990 RepID=A0A067LX24_BOTB1|nr:hypothetical protein BOTBODRAFT_140680 [Botryobasidium botryosum FD-172 SS1]
MDISPPTTPPSSRTAIQPSSLAPATDVICRKFSPSTKPAATASPHCAELAPFFSPLRQSGMSSQTLDRPTRPRSLMASPTALEGISSPRPPSRQSDVSSDLTSLSSTPHTRRRASSLPLASPPGNTSLNEIDVPPMPQVVPARALRQRNKLQLQPYTLERLRYRALLAGNKEAVIRDDARRRSPAKDPSSDNDEWIAPDSTQNEESQSQSLDLPPSPPPPRARAKDADRQLPPSPSPPDQTLRSPSFNLDDLLRPFGGPISSSDEDEPPASVLPPQRELDHPKKDRRKRPFPLKLAGVKTYSSKSLRRSRSDHEASAWASRVRLNSPSSPIEEQDALPLRLVTNASSSPAPQSKASSSHGLHTQLSLQLDGIGDTFHSEGDPSIPMDISTPTSPALLLDPSPPAIPGPSRKGATSSSTDSGSDEGEDRLTREDRRKMKALRRVMPAFMAKKLMNEQAQRDAENRLAGAAASRSRIIPADSSSESESESAQAGSLQPGQAKVRIVHKSGPLVIRGDSESSGPDAPVIIIGSSEEEPTDTSDSDDQSPEVIEEEIHTWLDMDRRSEDERPRDGDLINRMLSRTRGMSPVRRRPKPRVAGSSNPTRPLPRRSISNNTKPRRQGHKQTKLDFPVISKGKSSTKATAHNRRAAPQAHNLEHSEYPPARKSHKHQSGRPTRAHQRQSRKETLRVDDENILLGALAPITPQQPRPVATSQSQAPTPKALLRRRTAATQRRVVSDSDPEEPAEPSSDPMQSSPFRHITLNFGVPFPTPGLSLQSSPYLQNTRLQQLLSVLTDPEPARPWIYNAFDLNFRVDMTWAEFGELFPTLCDRLYDWATSPADTPVTQNIDEVMSSACQLVFWLASKSADVDAVFLAASVREKTRTLALCVSDWSNQHASTDRRLGFRTLSLYWFAIELSFRLACAKWHRAPPDEPATFDCVELDAYVRGLMVKLLDIGLQDATQGIPSSGVPHPDPAPNERLTELWVRLIHLVLCYTGVQRGVTPSDEFWKRIDVAIDTQKDTPKSELEKSERMWRAVFSICAISYLSPLGMVSSQPRLGSYWTLLAKALGYVRLTADERLDASLPKSIILMRDRYIRLVLARCLVLATKWQWRFANAAPLFHILADIFRSRKYANLRGEGSNFPTFITDRQDSERLLRSYDPRDASFDIFLKFMMQAGEDHQQDTAEGQDSADRIRQLRKILSMMVPVSATPFSRDNPPLKGEISMLYNRLSSVIVALRLQPSSSSSRVHQARRYVEFSTADWNSRQACVRAMMYMALDHINLHLDLQDVISWLSMMTSTLMVELQTVDLGLKKGDDTRLQRQRGSLIVLIQLLLGSVRFILEAPKPDDDGVAAYPNPELLQASWLSEIFKSSLIDDPRTGDEIRRFIQTFLDARTKALPPPRRPLLALEDSQEDYGDIDFDLNDPGLIAALEGDAEGGGQPDPLRELDLKVAKIMDSVISPGIYRLLRQHFTMGVRRREGTQSLEHDDNWIVCWAGCGEVLVRNGLRDWSAYFQLGSESWGKISDPNGRRRVGLRFMSTVLHLDPMAYMAHKDRFIEMWFQAIVTPAFTIEHQYVSAVLSIDAFQHPLFHELPIVTQGDFNLSIAELRRQRPAILKCVFRNLADRIAEEPERDARFKVKNEAGRAALLEMLYAMKDHLQSMQQDDTGRPLYTQFCTEVVQCLQDHLLTADDRVKNAATAVSSLIA